jgi:hypothetical protein
LQADRANVERQKRLVRAEFEMQVQRLDDIRSELDVREQALASRPVTQTDLPAMSLAERKCVLCVCEACGCCTERRSVRCRWMSW